MKIKFRGQIDLINVEPYVSDDVVGKDMTEVEVEFDHVPTASELMTALQDKFKSEVGVAPYRDVFGPNDDTSIAYVWMVYEGDEFYLDCLGEISDQDIVNMLD